MNALKTPMDTRILTYALKAAQPIALLIVTAACAVAPLETVPAEPRLLAIVTWNMNAGRGDLPRLVTDLEAGRLSRGHAAHSVVLLQEAVEEDLPRLQQLADARGWSMLFVPVHHDGRRTRGNAILSSRPILNPRAIPLPRERQPRIAAAGAIDVAGQRLFVVSAHLENRVSWWRAGLGSGSARGRQVDALLKALPTGTPGIVGGDFNTWLGLNEPAWRVLARRFDDTPASTRTPTFGPLILDHVFLDLPAGWRAIASVVADTYLSDHHPVVATITTSASSRVAAR